MLRASVLVCFAGLVLPAGAAAPVAAAPVELHQRIALSDASDRRIALTLDACGGGYDAELIEFLVARRIAATVFVTRNWLERNPQGLAALKAHADLYQIEDHGARHVPAVIGGRVYGIAGAADVGALRREILDGAAAIEQAVGVAPRWYRGATAEYDAGALQEIRRLGFRVAGFSVNADAGATLPRGAVLQRLRGVQPGDIIIAHMNKPAADTYEGLRPALLELQARGLVFVRLDQVELQPAP